MSRVYYTKRFDQGGPIRGASASRRHRRESHNKEQCSPNPWMASRNSKRRCPVVNRHGVDGGGSRQHKKKHPPTNISSNCIAERKKGTTTGPQWRDRSGPVPSLDAHGMARPSAGSAGCGATVSAGQGEGGVSGLVRGIFCWECDEVGDGTPGIGRMG